MNLNFDKESLDISSKKVITGVIALKIKNDFYFPEKNWNDSIVVLLNSWIQNLEQILSNQTSEVLCNFFDGPFSFMIIKKDDRHEIKFFLNKKIIGTHNINFDEFGKNMAAICQEVIKETKFRNWNNDDVNKLEYSLEKILPYFL
ncbi:hypothetical protein ACR780_10110 [Sphingobacterium faecium]|uniref:hypothetical protein n=1 Tax=Sphingobacterium faecium TaxID=34087 RepID=UPI003DA4F58A